MSNDSVPACADDDAAYASVPAGVNSVGSGNLAFFGQDSRGLPKAPATMGQTSDEEGATYVADGAEVNSTGSGDCASSAHGSRNLAKASARGDEECFVCAVLAGGVDKARAGANATTLGSSEKSDRLVDGGERGVCGESS